MGWIWSVPRKADTMRHWFELIRKRWADWVGDRDMQIKILAALRKRGLDSRTTAIEQVCLVAIERPGWVQIYAFECADSQLRVFGLARMDERNVDHIELFEERTPRDDAIRTLAEGMILHRRWRLQPGATR